MESVRLALHAMNTRFELVLQGGDSTALRAMGEEALREISRLEELLSAFKPTSEIAHVNARAEIEAIQVSSEVFNLLKQCREIWEHSNGAMDVTIGSLMKCWGFWGAGGHFPDEAKVEQAREQSGFEHLLLDEQRRTVRFQRQGMTVDLGAIGKGYAIDCAVELLREAGVRSALVHGGTSTTYAIGRPLDGTQWRVAVPTHGVEAGQENTNSLTIDLCDQAIGVSAVSEKSFTANGQTFGHVIDPRTGWPVEKALLSAAVATSATSADAWSTALMVLGEEGLELLQRHELGCKGLVVTPAGTIRSIGMEGNSNAGSDRLKRGD